MDAQFTSPDPRGMRGRERRQPIIGKQGASPLRCASSSDPWTLDCHQKQTPISPELAELVSSLHSIT